MLMPRTPEELNEIAGRAEAWLDAIDVDELQPTMPPAVEAIAVAHHDVALAERALVARVVDAREAGHSWAEIGRVLGVSRQAAQQRFGAHTAA